MQGLSFTFSAATLFLVLCLQLGIIESQDNKNVRKPILFDLHVPSTAEANQEISVKLKLQTQYEECMEVKAYLLSSVPMEGAFNYTQTHCLCNDHTITLFWDFEVIETVKFAIVLKIVNEKNICPNDLAVLPIKGDQYLTYRTEYTN
ncbi:prolactin-inducible protein homolog [Mus caroli]|uniref:Prolactin-inducible protein homolog n=1 Tax=Mus caroli TaxID=10089 RepID=A0A6P5PB05_MUSCR|nr:prolactin-inducible protein homolog [Mus caroli]